MSDWYLATQLKNFQEGVRGSHPQDMYGPQMALMSATLADDQAINDLVAYINAVLTSATARPSGKGSRNRRIRGRGYDAGVPGIWAA
jgi:cytochrome c oxidase subunit 2